MRSPREIFDFTLNPSNTSKWVPSIIEGVSDKFPPEVGTKYKNRGASTDWDWYTIVELTEDKSFTMAAIDGNYHVRYTLTPQGENKTELEYFEWMNDGTDLPAPFTMEPLQIL